MTWLTTVTRVLAGSTLLLLAGISRDAAAQNAPQPSSPPSIDERIRFYAAAAAEHPDHYPALALLGAASLDKARETGDPLILIEARTALERSLTIQSSYEALRAMTALCNYGHRFAEAATWGRKAADAAPGDPIITVMRVEAHLGLGQLTEAEALLPDLGSPPDEFHLAAARAQCLLARGQADEAFAAFLHAADLADRLGAREQAVWARVTASGVRIDRGRHKDVVPLLKEATAILPEDFFLRIHLAEVTEAEGRLEDAMTTYERLLNGKADADLHRHAARLARQLGRANQAREHFEAARALYRKPIELGHVYTLEGLARLLEDAGEREQAHDLARRNLEFKRDGDALELFRRTATESDATIEVKGAPAP